MAPNARVLQWILRIGVGGEFVGHGVFALNGKAQWIGWISDMLDVTTDTATTILTVIGVADVSVGILVLFVPIPAVLLWATVWGFWTALVRPLVGEPIWDFVERWANWAAPLALLVHIGVPKNLRGWYKISR